jgi:tetratricopeptide (TPR) repeat protein
VATSRGVAYVDYPQLLAAAGDAPEPRGADWFLDHVHPTIEGHQLLAHALLERLHEIGWLSVDPRTAREEIERMQARVMAGFDPERHGVALRNLAKVLSWAGKTEEAARAAERALELLPDDSESLFVLALEAAEWDEHDRAAALLRETLREDPDWVKPRLNLGVELARMGRLGDAREEYERVLELAPDHPSVRFNLAHVLARMGRQEEAIVAYRETLAMNPQDEEARRLLAELTGDPLRP